LQWATGLAGQLAPEQITGHDIFRIGVALAHRYQFRVFLLGAEFGTAKRIARRLKEERPGLEIDGTDGGKFTSDGQNANNEVLLEQIRSFDPHLIFVALGAPKQELWIADNLAKLAPCVLVGVGSVFDTQAGILPSVPRWIYGAGLGSLFQLLIAPRRYARRYLIEDPPTFGRALGQALKHRLRQKTRLT
jgi:N-acetylglucosaminyldiphosphoundecaprenol N-acetyl-beta-D-mannosaminyltransferase